ncbi:MAG TPA: winged helix-turn-helix domain-containing protein [Candidatus Paceibacterota bacterium]
MKTAKQLERHLKGLANHRRIEVLRLVKKSDGITLDEISEKLNCNVKTLSEHVRRLALAGLVDKKYKGRSVAHSLSPYGARFLSFIDTF